MDAGELPPLQVLIATDCLSEGINLRHFTGVRHYDLPRNPNQPEQREGPVDRFGNSDEAAAARTNVTRKIDEAAD